jgi:hypothetical protein
VPLRIIPQSAVKRSLQLFGSQLSQLPTINFSVLFVADFFHPVDRFAVQRLLNGDVRHRGRRRSVVPMLLTGWNPDHIARPPPSVRGHSFQFVFGRDPNKLAKGAPSGQGVGDACD